MDGVPQTASLLMRRIGRKGFVQFDLPATSIVPGLGVGGSYEIELLEQTAPLQVGCNYLVATNVGQAAIATLVSVVGDVLKFGKFIVDESRPEGIAAKCFQLDRGWVEHVGLVRRRMPDVPASNKKRPHTASQQPRACRRRGKLRSAVAAA